MRRYSVCSDNDLHSSGHDSDYEESGGDMSDGNIINGQTDQHQQQYPQLHQRTTSVHQESPPSWSLKQVHTRISLDADASATGSSV